MDHTFCPGSKILRQPAPEFFTCPSCGEEVEIWTDELKRNCLKCGKSVYRDAGMSCLDWCKHGKDCVGDSVYDTYMKNKSVGIKKCLMDRIRSHFGDDKTRIVRAGQALSNAERILNGERADWHIVIPASILHDLGIDGTKVAREILLRLGLRMPDINEICELIDRQNSPDQLATDNSRVLADSVDLVGFDETAAGNTAEQLADMIAESFQTDAGRALAAEMCADASTAARTSTRTA